MSIEVKKIYKNDPLTDKLFGHILIDSFNYVRKNYGYTEEVDLHRLDRFWEIIDKEFVYVIIKQNKAIGFLFFLYHSEIKSLSFRLFVYSKACPMSLRSLLKVALFRFMLEVTSKQTDIEKLSFSTWHPSIVSLTKMYLPDLIISTYSPSDFECTKIVNEKDITYFTSILDKSITYNTNNFDEFRVNI